MRVHLRLNRKFCLFLTLIAAIGVGAFAQGRGAATTATNGFYRFNYSMEEMQPIAYPAQAIATKGNRRRYACRDVEGASCARINSRKTEAVPGIKPRATRRR